MHKLRFSTLKLTFGMGCHGGAHAKAIAYFIEPLKGLWPSWSQGWSCVGCRSTSTPTKWRVCLEKAERPATIGVDKSRQVRRLWDSATLFHWEILSVVSHESWACQFSGDSHNSFSPYACMYVYIGNGNKAWCNRSKLAGRRLTVSLWRSILVWSRKKIPRIFHDGPTTHYFILKIQPSVTSPHTVDSHQNLEDCD